MTGSTAVAETTPAAVGGLTALLTHDGETLAMNRAVVIWAFVGPLVLAVVLVGVVLELARPFERRHNAGKVKTGQALGA